MSHSFSNLNVHLIFHTKSNACVMDESDLARIFRYIGGLIHALSGYAYIVGGRPDHIHILTTLPLTKSVSDFVREIKANSSRWIKSIGSKYQHFAWQEGYGVFSVSESNKDSVINYIHNQKEHHRHLSAQEEFNLFLRKHGLRKVDSLKE